MGMGHREVPECLAPFENLEAVDSSAKKTA